MRNALGREQGLGSHWTASKETAEVFAEQVPGGYRKLGPDVIPSGSGYAPHTTITADIPMSSVETDTNVLKSKDVVGKSGKYEYPHEQEIPVKEGAPVYVKEIQSKSPKKNLANKDRFQRHRVRTKRFNPPKEMKA